MTACIANLFTWNYATEPGTLDLGIAAITAADRMFTAGDVEYEPRQIKSCFLTSRIIVLISGDIATHSDALLIASRQVKDNPEDDVYKMAQMYADCLSTVRKREATKLYLSPLGLDLDSFIQRQHEMSAGLIAELTHQLQNHRTDYAEALIVGADDMRAHIFLIDSNGMVKCQNDLGFSAIGIGAPHAKSIFMRAEYSSSFGYSPALMLAFAAKANAHVAPGVGFTTDMFLITRVGWEPIAPGVLSDLHQYYDDYKQGEQALIASMLGKTAMSVQKNALPRQEAVKANEVQNDDDLMAQTD